MEISLPVASLAFTFVFGVVMFLYQRQVNNADNAAAADAEKAAKEYETYKAEVHQGFQDMHRRIDDERTHRENLKDEVHNLELELAERVKREELTTLREEMNKSIQASTTQIVGVIQAMTAKNVRE